MKIDTVVQDVAVSRLINAALGTTIGKLSSYHRESIGLAVSAVMFRIAQ
jgi:hypothetical protein